MRNLSRVLWVLGLFLATGCGYSEDEWQAQLAKYEAAVQRNDELQGKLAEQRARVDELSKQLEDMGVELSSAGTEKEQLSRSMEEMKSALEEYKKRAEVLERVKARLELLRKKLEALTNLGLDVNIRNNRMVISLPGDVLFASGKDKLRPQGKKILQKVAEVIRGDPSLKQRMYQVAGHTDNLPLKRAAEDFHDNWGLSLMRARQVLVFLIAPAEGSDEGGKQQKKKKKKKKTEPGGGLDPKLWSAAGYGATDPAASNSTAEGRAKNRRVELVLIPNVEEMLDLKSLL